ncbi:MAG: C10 family peptidase [Bacteroidetes bacterium]|nr:C10 family peptidase [Bacteroidota bacterium]
MNLKFTFLILLTLFFFRQVLPAKGEGPGKHPLDVGPMVTVHWNQGCYYDEKCPADVTAATSCYHAFAGSGAVAMAQIMKYYNYPPHGYSSHTYTHPQYGNLYVNFSAATYNWLDMTDTLASSNDAVSTLIYHCGVGQEMNYGPVKSSSVSSLIDTAFRIYFGYSKTAIWKWKADYPADQWRSMLRAELDAGRPLLYYGNDGGTNEKYFICDGYQGTDTFHFNWGDGGKNDGFFPLTGLTPGTENYNYAQGAIFNLAPDQPASSVKMDFETVSDFSLNFSPWTVRDMDADSTYGILDHTFPNNGSPMAFIAFNPAQVNPSMATDPEIQPHDGSRFGASFAAIHVPNNDWFISPQIQLGTNGQFAFWERSYTDQYGLEKFNVLVSATDNNPSSFTLLSGVVPEIAPLQWTKKVYSLSGYNNQKVYVAVQCVSDNAFLFMIDDLEVTPSSASSLTAGFSSDKTTIRAGEKVSFTDESTGNPTSWRWTFPGGFPPNADIENPANIRYDIPGTYNVSLKISDGTGADSLTKVSYITVTGYPSYMSLDFESLDDFTLNFSPWSVYDVNGGPTYGIDSVSFPNSGVPMSFICFNPSHAVPPPRNMTPHSGSKFGACFSSVTAYAPNDKWLISPKMTLGSNPSIRFWVQTYNISYLLEKFNVGVSTTTSNPSSFVMLNNTPLDAPADWTRQSFSLSAYAGQDVYIGINCVSDDQFIFMIDDIEIGSALGVEEFVSANGIRMYPNPASDHVFVNFGNRQMFAGDLTLLNETGSVLNEVHVNRNPGEDYRLSLSGLSSGIYYLVINSGQGRIMKKIAVVN